MTRRHRDNVRLDTPRVGSKAADVNSESRDMGGHAKASADPQSSRSKGIPFLLRALRHRNYQLFFAGQFISLTGTWMQGAAQSWLVYRLTGSARLLGFVAFSSQIPVLLLSLIGGSTADRHNRRCIVIGTQIAAMVLAFTLAALTLTGRVQVWHVFALAGLLGVVNAFDIPTRQAFVMDMVGREDLINAIALNSLMINGARMVGPAVAGVLVASIGEGWCFLANGVSFLAVIAGLLMMTGIAQTHASRTGSALGSIIEGFRYIQRTRPVRALLLLVGLVSLLGVPYAVLMPIFADQILHGGSRGYGILMGASGFGALMGALVLAAKKNIQGLGHWMAFAATGFGVSLILFSCSRSFWLSATLLLPAGFCMMIGLASANTLIQSLVPDHLRGRVMSVYSMMFLGMVPFGSLLAGTLADHLSAPATVAIGGTACITAALIFGLRLPALHREAGQIIVALQAADGEPPEEITDKPGILTPREI